MKFENKIVFDKIKTAVKMWACKLDGYDGAIGGIICEIPWSSELEPVVSWDLVSDKFSDCIPSCPSYDIKDVLNCASVFGRLEGFSCGVAKKICDLYADIVRKVNENTFKIAKIKRLRGVENCVCQYEIVDVVSGDSWFDVIHKIYHSYNCKTKWNAESDFFDVCYEAVYNKHMSIHLIGDVYVEFSSCVC